MVNGPKEKKPFASSEEGKKGYRDFGERGLDWGGRKCW